MGKVRMDERGRILVPLDDREKLGLQAGTEFDLKREDGVLVLKPVVPKIHHVNGTRRKWGSEAFFDVGEATFGDE